MLTPALDDFINRSRLRNAVPFLACAVVSKDRIAWHGCYGEARDNVPADVDTIVRLFSLTKAINAVALAILLERGGVRLDDSVESYLPEFALVADLQRSGARESCIHAKHVTVRQLATHTSGLGYEFWSPELADLHATLKLTSILSGQASALYSYPLLHEPGARWTYGVSHDWLGLLIQTIDGRPIDRFVSEEILRPLGMLSTSFGPRREHLDRLADVSLRTPDGGRTVANFAPPENPDLYGMGHAMYSSARDYLTFLRLLLNRGHIDGIRLFSEETADCLLENQIGTLRVGKLVSTVPSLAHDFEIHPGAEKSHSLAFARMEVDVPHRRLAGSQGWAGALNTHCWLDPKAGLAAVYITQSLPFASPDVMEDLYAFEYAVYADLRSS